MPIRVLTRSETLRIGSPGVLLSAAALVVCLLVGWASTASADNANGVIEAPNARGTDEPADPGPAADLDSDDSGGIPIFALGIGLAAAIVAGVIGYRWSISRAAPVEQTPVKRRRPPRPGGPS